MDRTDCRDLLAVGGGNFPADQPEDRKLEQQLDHLAGGRRDLRCIDDLLWDDQTEIRLKYDACVEKSAQAFFFLVTVLTTKIVRMGKTVQKECKDWRESIFE